MNNTDKVIPVDVAKAAGIEKEKFINLYAGYKLIIARLVYTNQLKNNK